MNAITYWIVVALLFAMVIEKARLDVYSEGIENIKENIARSNVYSEGIKNIKENVGLGIGAIIGIIVAVVVVVIGCCICICYLCCQCCRKSQPVIVNQTNTVPGPTIIALPTQDRDGGFSNMMSEVSPPPYTDYDKVHH